MSRRRFLELTALAATTALAGCSSSTEEPPAGASPAATGPTAAAPGAAPGTQVPANSGGMGGGSDLDVPKRFASFVTPNEHFYITTYSTTEPEVDLDSWQLSITALDGTTTKLSFADLSAHSAAVERMITLECVGNGPGGSLISNALWRGVPLTALFDASITAGDPYKVVMRAADGYHTAIPLSAALDGQTILAWEMNGEPLPRSHGFPVRIIVPGRYGMKGPKWITAIEMVDHDYMGYWESRGWDDDATIVPMSRFINPRRFAEISPQRLQITGLAFGGSDAVGAVEISTDRRNSWQPATLTTEAQPFVWSFWQFEWDLSGRTGRSSAQASLRCSDSSGQRQKEQAPPQLPDGRQTHEAGLDTLEVIIQS